MTTKPTKIFNFSIEGRKFNISFYPLHVKPPEEIERLTKFYDLWKSYCINDQIPTKDAITFERLVGWHSNVRLVDLGIAEGSSKKTILLGETFRSFWGNETFVSKILENETDKKTLADFHETVELFLDYNYSISFGIAPNIDGRLQNIIWIDLPLSSDGKKITHLLSALIPVGK